MRGELPLREARARADDRVMPDRASPRPMPHRHLCLRSPNIRDGR